MAEISLYSLFGLFGLGKSLSTSARPPAYNKGKTKPIKINGTDMYNSKDFYNVSATEAKKVIENFENARYPIMTNIIPRYFNTISVKTDSTKIANEQYDPNLIYKVLDTLNPEMQKVIRDKISKTSYINKHINDNQRITNPEWALVSGLNPVANSSNTAGIKDGELTANLMIGGSLLPNQGQEDFTHNNMVPFYKGALKQNVDIDNRMTGGKLELYTGQFKLNQQQKHEIAPMFTPVSGMTNINGNLFTPDLTRYIPSNCGKKSNELPFDQLRVGPGLNNGFTAMPTGGFHPTLRINALSKTELLVDPVVETEGRINAGKAPTENRTLISQQYKNKPELLVKNENGERNFVTTGEIKGRTLRPGQIVKDTNRKHSKFLITAGKIAQGGANVVVPKAHISHKSNFENVPFRNAKLSQGGKINDFGKSGIENRVNERFTTQDKSTLLNPLNIIKRITQYFFDDAKKTRKQFYVDAPRANGNAVNYKEGPSYDPNDTMKTTIRETTEINDKIGNATGQSKLIAYDPNDRTKTTIKETTENFNKIGNATGQKKLIAYDPNDSTRTTIRETTEINKDIGTATGQKKLIAYDPNDTMRTTIRETTENFNKIGNVNSSKKKLIAYDPNDTARTTIRETTENFNGIGNVNSSKKKLIAYDPNDTTRTTIRETTEVNNKIGNVNSSKKKSIAYDPNDTAKTTTKETTETGTRIGNKNDSTTQGATAYMTTNVYAKPTQKAEVSNHEYFSIAKATEASKMASRDDAYASTQNINREIIAKGRKPTNSSVKTVVGSDWINQESKKIEGDRLNRRSVMKTSDVNNIYNPNAVRNTVTSDKNQLPQLDQRLDPIILDPFKKNPLTQSLASYA